MQDVPDEFKKMSGSLNTIYAHTQAIRDLLKQFDDDAERVGFRPVSQMSLTDLVKFAEFILKVKAL